MTQALKQEVLNRIELVYNMSQDGKLDQNSIESMSNELDFLADYLHVSPLQALLFSVIFVKGITGNSVDADDLIRHFNCHVMKMIQYNDELMHLVDKHLLKRERARIRLFEKKLSNLKGMFTVNELVTERILNSDPIPESLNESVCISDEFTMLERVDTLAGMRSTSELSTKELFEEFDTLLEDCGHFDLVQNTKSLSCKIEDRFLFLYVVWKFLDGDRDPSVERVFKVIYDTPNQRFNQMQSFLNKEHTLIKEGWLDMEEARFFDDANMKITDKAMAMLYGCGIKLFNKEKKSKNLIQPEDIPLRELIFSGRAKQHLDLVTELLGIEKFHQTQTRLQSKAMSTGIGVLFHGSPGTGKTESVLQMAKATQRKIMKVDISASRSMWFGESEKKIKQVFETYQNALLEEEHAPILFFNEADALISKRKDVGISATGETENRIQNILLEELENFRGILIATTNLVNNLDSAFDRRFLFKVEFQQPDLEVRSKIWKQKLPHLSSEDCSLLASQFDFSGGQIDNIARKSEINEVLFGFPTLLDDLVEMCKNEILNTKYQSGTLGFKKGV